MMGVLPLQFMEGELADSLGFSGKETIDIIIGDNIKPGDLAEVVARSDEGSTIRFKAKIRFESLVDMEYYRHGGILQMVLRQKMAQ